MIVKYGLPKEQIEVAAMNQIKALLELPCLEELTILPDVHAGYDAPIGSVVRLKGYISPGMVGYDLACGVSTIITPYTPEELRIGNRRAQDALYMRLMNHIPIIRHKDEEKWKEAVVTGFNCEDKALKKEVHSVMKEQFGTMGSGNHFLEVGVNKEGFVCITVHSGSRRAGWLIGDYWMKKAKTEGTTFGNLSMFELGSENAAKYIEAYEWAAMYARRNRRAMLEHVFYLLGMQRSDLAKSKYINTTHNMFVNSLNGVIHRKGACSAFHTQDCLIPGNMRDGVFIASGLGNTEYQSSCSHGAGRVMSRKAARVAFTIDDAFDGMEDIHHCKTSNHLDEAPGAYKDIDQVLSLQDGKNIVVTDHIKTLVGLKG